MKLPTFENPLKLFTPAFAGAPQGASGMNGGHMMFASSGSGSGGGGYDDDDYGYDDDYGVDDEPQAEPAGQRPQSNRTRRSAGRANASGGRSRSASVQPEERYWTDYLRIALPVIGIILMLGLLWIWASSLLGDDSDVGDENNEDEIGLVATQTPDPNAVNTQGNAAGTPTGPPQNETNTGEIPISNQGDEQPATSPEADNGGTFNPTQNEQPEDGGDNQAGEETTEEEPPAEGEEPPAEGGEIAVNSRVRVTEDNLNIRSSASTADEPIGTAMAGDEAVVASGPEEAEGFIWWEVVFDDGSGGFVVQEYLEVIP